jgi:hypothetical protein
MTKFEIPFDIQEAIKSNILVSGSNATGKSRLACGICSVLQTFNWKIVAFDNTGIWKTISDLPISYLVTENRNFDKDREEWFYPFSTESMIFDTSLLLPVMQKSFVDDVLRRLWNAQVRNPQNQWTLVALEEFQLFGRDVRSSVAQNILRIASAGRNHKVRVLAITVDLALVDSAFIRLTSQRYHAKISSEENGLRKFRNYYGLDNTRICRELDLGYFLYYLNDKIKIVHVPLFQPSRLPESYQEAKPQPKPSLWQKIKEVLK